MNLDFRADPAELRALCLFVSSDETREHLSKLWLYEDERGEGNTYLATDGHTLACRRAGTHRHETLAKIAEGAPMIVDEHGRGIDRGDVHPPDGWGYLLEQIHPRGKIADDYGMNPTYFGRLAHVEKAAGNRSIREMAKPSPGFRMREIRAQKDCLRREAMATLVIPSDPNGGWRWTVKTGSALWQGILMPRRVA
jgi:hypothetical protein